MTTVAVIGLGYVGLPLAVEFGKVFDTIGFDLSSAKIANFRKHEDPTGEVSREQFQAATKLQVPSTQESAVQAVTSICGATDKPQQPFQVLLQVRIRSPLPMPTDVWLQHRRR